MEGKRGRNELSEDAGMSWQGGEEVSCRQLEMSPDGHIRPQWKGPISLMSSAGRLSTETVTPVAEH